MSTDCIQYATKNKFTYRVSNEKLLKNKDIGGNYLISVINWIRNHYFGRIGRQGDKKRV